MEEQMMLTTVDNPYDPFTQFPQWLSFDTRKGYNTSGLLARIALTSDDLSESDQRLAVNNAIREIVEINALGIHRAVTRSGPVT